MGSRPRPGAEELRRTAGAWNNEKIGDWWLILYVYIYIIKGSLDEKLPSYGVLKMRENSKVENRRVENNGVENSREEKSRE